MDTKIIFITVVAALSANAGKIVAGSPHISTTAKSKFPFVFPKIPIGNFDSPKGIVGGRDSTAGEFPFLVSIQVTPRGEEKYHSCGGVIVDATHIVTAAHCIEGEILKELEVVAGAHNIQNPFERFQQRVKVKRMVYHPKYNSYDISHDGAVITLASPLTFNHRVSPLRLAPLNHEPSGSCVTIGWGNTNPAEQGFYIMPHALQKVTLNIVDRETCRTLYKHNGGVDDTMICASPSKSHLHEGHCNGDSGGPLLCSDYDGGIYLAGIVSWGIPPCGNPKFPDVFGNVANMRLFFDHQISRQ